MKSSNTLAALAVLLAAASARADSDSLVTVGVGTGLGVSHTTPFKAAGSASFTTDLSVKLKLLHVLGFEFSYSPTDGADPDEALVFDAHLRVSGLLYIVPTYPVGLYLKGGIGGDSFASLFSISEPSNSYHAGAGLDVYVGDHVVLGAEFLMLIPGVQSIKNTLSTVATEEIARYRADGHKRTPEEAAAATPPVAVTDFVSPSNFRASLNARWYF